MFSFWYWWFSNELVLPSHYVSVLYLQYCRQRRLQRHLPSLPCCALQPQTNIRFLPSCAKQGVCLQTLLFPSSASTSTPCSFNRMINRIAGQHMISKAKASQIAAHTNHSETSESIHLFYHHLLLLEKAPSAAQSPLGPEESHYN